jgi:hypothetical protein
MLLEISLKKVSVRNNGENTGSETYRADGWIGKSRFRLALGTERKEVAQRRAVLIERAAQEGADSAIWREMKEALPRRTFQFFAGAVGYKEKSNPVFAKPTWGDLCDLFELEMQRLPAACRRISHERG